MSTLGFDDRNVAQEEGAMRSIDGAEKAALIHDDLLLLKQLNKSRDQITPAPPQMV